uniref:Uncharacterized protein n=1 Tax=Salix viminalis TaxID=40686 RepID=A0A6N2NCX3_SALVM
MIAKFDEYSDRSVNSMFRFTRNPNQMMTKMSITLIDLWLMGKMKFNGDTKLVKLVNQYMKPHTSKFEGDFDSYKSVVKCDYCIDSRSKYYCPLISINDTYLYSKYKTKLLISFDYNANDGV